jgi:hypothetical protein
MARSSDFRWAPNGRRDILNATGSGILNMVLYGEERLKAHAVVRGGHRSYLTGSHLGGPLGIGDVPGTSRGRATVGGTLRRSAHAVVFVDGRVLPGSRTVDENGTAIPAYSVTGEVIGYLGFNCGYSEFVDQGTARMPARPMIQPATQDMLANARNLFTAGWSAYAGRF